MDQWCDERNLDSLIAAAFLLYGATDVAMGWPLRYSHSPAEVVDVRDVEGLSKIIASIAQAW